jgi:NAD(P)-dependent dehydrogenase (short-subunit alcohol dehydrogenase family)
MQQGKHSGKIVLSMTDEHAQVPVIPRDSHPLALHASATYLLVGGLGGLGRAQALWFAANGAKNLAFVSRSGGDSEAAQRTLQQLREQGVNAKAYKCDVADRDALAKVLGEIDSQMPKIRGVITGAMVLSDSFFSNMSFEDWTTTFRPKVQGTWNLHELLSHDLDFFIMLSSLAGIFGSRGQSNYAAGNTFQDALAHHRAALGLPAVSLDLGMMAGFGFVEENRDNVAMNSWMRHFAAVSVEPDEFYSILKSAITGYTEGETRMPAQACLGSATGGMARFHNLNDEGFYWHEDIIFSELRHIDTLGEKSSGGGGESGVSLALSSATTAAACMLIVQEALIGKLAKALMIPLEDIDITKSISAYGVDSLVAVEVRNWIAREIQSDLSVFEILSPVPLSQLIQKLVVKSTLVAEEFKAEAGADMPAAAQA